MHERVTQQQQTAQPQPPQLPGQPSVDPYHHHHHHRHYNPNQQHQQPVADATNNRRPRNNNSRLSASSQPVPDHHRRRRDVTSAGINGTGSPALLLASPNSSTSSLNSDIDRQTAAAAVNMAPDPLSASPLVRYVSVAVPLLRLFYDHCFERS